MSQEPEKEIEKQLREHAEQRRAEADAKLGAGMHPATRRLLQGEISRTYGIAAATEPKAAKPWWSYWPGLIFAGGLAAVLLLVFVNHSPKEELGSSQMAKLEQLPPSSPPPPAAAPAALSATPPSARARSLSLAPANVEMRKDLAAVEPQAARKTLDVQNPEPAAKLNGTISGDSRANSVMVRDADGAVAMKDSALRPSGGALPASPPPAPVTVAPAVSKAMVERESLVSDGIVNKPMDPAKRAATAAPAPSSASALAKADTYSVQGAVVMKQNSPVPKPASGGVYFENKLVSVEEKSEATAPQPLNQAALRKNFQSPPRPAVLTQFQVEQNGNEVRFIDQDGSVYVGQIAAATDKGSPPADTKKEADKKEAMKTNASESQYYILYSYRGGGLSARSFRASGLNVTLNQNVVVSGEFVNQPALAGKKQNPTNFNKSAIAPAEKSKAVMVPPTQIQGRVQIGEHQEMILNAVPVVK